MDEDDGMERWKEESRENMRIGKEDGKSVEEGNRRKVMKTMTQERMEGKREGRESGGKETDNVVD